MTISIMYVLKLATIKILKNISSKSNKNYFSLFIWEIKFEPSDNF